MAGDLDDRSANDRSGDPARGAGEEEDADAVVACCDPALVAAGAIHVDISTLDAMAYLHAATGMYGGPGYVALFGLLALRFSGGRQPRLVAAVAALGRRSLSGYLLQSVAWTVLFLPFMFDRGGSAHIAFAAAVAVWAASVLAARAMEARGQRGPAELLLRRLTYGRSSPAPYSRL